MTTRAIQLRGVAVHNLREIDLDLPHHQLIVFCGVSGSGKTSLALDTLYAEGQRRYIETFPAYTRQFLERLEKPDAEQIDGIPPAIAVTRKDPSRSSRSTIASSTDVADYLRLLMAKVGECVCSNCQIPVTKDSPESAAASLMGIGQRMMVCFPVADSGNGRERPALEDIRRDLREEGYVRALLVAPSNGTGPQAAQTWRLEEPATDDPSSEVLAVVDRLGADVDFPRLQESLETAFEAGHNRCTVLLEALGSLATSDTSPSVGERPLGAAAKLELDGRQYHRLEFSASLSCGQCGANYPAPEPRLFSFNSPLGACSMCEGFGNVVDIDMDLVVPDPSKTLREGAIAPWTTPAYSHELDELIALADDYKVPLDVPFRDLPDSALRIIHEGVLKRDFGGLQGFFAWLERRKYKTHIRIFLSRWRSYRPCPECQGARLRPEALATRLNGQNVADIMRMKIDEAHAFFAALELEHSRAATGRMMLDQVRDQLGYLGSVGLGYLTLDRPIRTLSGGEAQRVALTSALGSGLVNMLYVLDEPTAGLHPADVARLVGAVGRLRDRRNTVVVVEHEEMMLRSADHLVEIGPGAGERGGEVVFEGPIEQMLRSDESVTGQYLSGRRVIATPAKRRQPDHGWLRLTNVSGNNLQNIDVELPLGVLCLVTGVSGAGKSTLVHDTLYGALCQRKRKDGPRPLPFDDIFGDGQIDEVVMVDQSPIGRSPRSNPVTYVKAFDAIRAVFAETLEARTHNYSPGHFSFNVDGGRCPECDGDGYIKRDMQFLADVYMTCAACGGSRYRPEILEVHYRNRSIADVLDMTVREAFSFFRGQTKVQAKLKQLIDVGLDYLRLGQPANTLSAGESQRVKLAAYLSAASRNRTLFLLDEPTNGLHFSDIVQLLDAFDALLAVGHSLIIVEHNLQLMRAADYLIDLGPGAGDAGGRIVAQGTPEMVASQEQSVTGRFLRECGVGHQDAG
ncbi:MAG: excinuclease ABC subunit UvrA [Planctomycetales bacterium]|nr:excinuclease ABC subunit UvrA [Planctomycetales bacterium]